VAGCRKKEGQRFNGLASSWIAVFGTFVCVLIEAYLLRRATPDADAPHGRRRYKRYKRIR
jgi:hypothetical protein